MGNGCDGIPFIWYGKKLYLSPVLDLFTGEIIAYNFEKRPIYPLVSKMLEPAFNRLSEEGAPVLHSDQGWHYQMNKNAHVL